jgi:polysaccharide biosynthesis transport protein
MHRDTPVAQSQHLAALETVSQSARNTLGMRAESCYVPCRRWMSIDAQYASGPFVPFSTLRMQPSESFGAKNLPAQHPNSTSLFNSGGFGAPASAEDVDLEGSVLLKRSIAAVLRYKWLIVAIVVVSTTIAFFVRKQFSAVYAAEGKVWISAQSQPQRGPVRAAALLPSNSWGDLLASYAVLGKTVRELHLYVRPSNPRDDRLFSSINVRESVRSGSYVLRVDSSGDLYSLRAINGPNELPIENGTVGDSIGRKIGILWAPENGSLPKGRAIAFTLVSPVQAALDLRKRVSAELPRDGNLMRVYVTDTDGWRVALIANSLLNHLVATANDFKRRNLTEVRSALETQLSYASAALREADDHLERFRMQTITLPSEAGTPINGGIGVTRNPVITNYFNLKMSREAVAQQRTALEATLADVRSGKVKVEALWQVLPTERGAQEIGMLLQEYTKKEAQLRNDLLAFTEDYQGIKDARAGLAQLRDRAIPEMVNTIIGQLRRREDDLQQQIGAESSSLQQIPARTVEEVRLTRNVDARAQLYGMLRNRFEEAQLAELSIEPDLAILDAAGAPEAPISNRGRQFFVLAAFGSIAGAMALAVLLDRLDKRLRYVQQIGDRLRLSIIGAVPHTSHTGKSDPANVARLLESFRSLRLNVCYAANQARPLMFTVTSASASEGKSLVSANLALSFAEGGYRTLLIDGDFRRGCLHATFATDRRPGLVDVLIGSVGFAEALRPTSHPKLSLLPRGSRLATAPELLVSESFHRLVTGLASDYDVVLIDSPPLAAGMDPHALCVATTNVLFVVRLGKTDGHLARQKLELLARFPVRILGAVANDIQEAMGLNAEYSYLPEYSAIDADEVIATGAGHALGSPEFN